MSDLISRQALCEYALNQKGKCVTPNDIMRFPSAQPQWIPCSERLPNTNEFVVITILDDSGDIPVRYSDLGWYINEGKFWVVDNETRKDVIAWMPLPEPYGGESDETD